MRQRVGGGRTRRGARAAGCSTRRRRARWSPRTTQPRHGRGRGARAGGVVFNRSRRRPSRSRTTRSPTRRSGSSFATSTCGARKLQKIFRTRAMMNLHRAAVPHRQRLPRARDPRAGEVHPRRARATSSCRRGCTPGKFYALAESPAALQAALHGGGLRPVLPDHPLLPRRRPPPRPAARVHPGGHRDVLRQPGRHLRHVEGLVFALWKEVFGVDLRDALPRRALPPMRFDESMRRYGNDKPDLRFGMSPHRPHRARRRARRAAACRCSGRGRGLPQGHRPARPARAAS
jgi:hypothetical protein